MPKKIKIKEGQVWTNGVTAVMVTDAWPKDPPEYIDYRPLLRGVEFWGVSSKVFLERYPDRVHKIKIVSE